MPPIETTALTKRYGAVTAVDGLDLAVERGEVFGFLGPNGAGKSTTIDLLLGFQRPTAGSVTVLGHDTTAESRAVRARTGLLPEGYALYENLTARDHLRSAIDVKDADDDPADLVERVGLDSADARRRVGEYSTGMCQRLALAIALVGEPDLLVLDEPASGLDPSGVRRLRTVVREEAERGATVFFSSHVLDQVERVCDRVGVLVEGDLVAVDEIGALREALDVHVTVAATVESVPDLDSVRAVDGVATVTVAGDVVRAECATDEAKMAVLERLHEATRVRDVDTEDASLETLFETLTERSATDRTADGGTGAAGETAPNASGVPASGGGE